MASPWQLLARKQYPLMAQPGDVVAEDDQPVDPNAPIDASARAPAASPDLAAQAASMYQGLPQIEPRSGGKVDVKESDTTKRLTNTTSKTFASPDQIQGISDALDQLPEARAMHSGEASLASLLQSQAGAIPPQVDLSPLMALVDSQTGSKLSQGYQRPTTPQQMLDRAVTGAKMLQDERSKDYTDKMAGVRAFSTGTTQDLLQTILANQAGASKTDFMGKNATQMYQQRLQLARQAQKELGDLRTAGGVLNNVTQALASVNPTELKTVKTLLARIQEGTVRPQISVISQESGDPSLLQRWDNWVNTLKSGRVTDEQLGQYRDFVKDLVNTHQLLSGSAVAKYHTMNDGIMLPYNEQEFNQIFGQGYVNPFPSTAQQLKHVPTPQHKVPYGSNAPAAPPAAPAGGFGDFLKSYMQQKKAGSSE